MVVDDEVAKSLSGFHVLRFTGELCQKNLEEEEEEQDREKNFYVESKRTAGGLEGFWKLRRSYLNSGDFLIVEKFVWPFLQPEFHVVVLGIVQIRQVVTCLVEPGGRPGEFVSVVCGPGKVQNSSSAQFSNYFLLLKSHGAVPFLRDVTAPSKKK